MKLAGVICCVSAALAQSAPPAFEAASIRPHEGPLTRMSDFAMSGPRVTLVAYTTFGLILEAYGLKRHEVSFTTPPDDTFYDIVAKAEGNAPHTLAEVRAMLQTLLAERFRLKVHREGKEMPVYALVVGKSGPKFKESGGDGEPRFLGGVNGRNQYIDAKKMTMERLANNLDFIGVDRPVIDRTGLTGMYDVRVEATPERRLRDFEPGDLSVFTAVQEQLGLKLEPQKATIEVLVVDHVERPSGN